MLHIITYRGKGRCKNLINNGNMLAIYTVAICNCNLIQNSTAVKKCAAPKKAIVKKDAKSKVAEMA